MEFHVKEDDDTEEAALDTDFQEVAGIADGRLREKENRNK